MSNLVVEGVKLSGRQATFKPLADRNQNFISMVEDPEDEHQRLSLQRLLSWEAKLHNPYYLNAENIAKFAK